MYMYEQKKKKVFAFTDNKKNNNIIPVPLKYRTHTVSCYEIKTSVVSLANTEKHLDSLTLLTSFSIKISLQMLIISF